MESQLGYASEERLSSTLEELFDTTSLKWIFVGGKGGVGKTTTSCAVAVELAKRRESVLILSTDPAHNLSDAFSQKFSSSPALVEGFTNLYAMEIDPTRRETNEFTLGADDKEKDGDFLKFIPELLSAFPGIDEALSFAELMNSVRTMNYSVIVFDTAPTGHTLRLIGFPDILEKGLSKLVSFREKMSGALSMVTTMTGNALNEEELHHKLDSIRALTASVRALFQDPTRTTFVCVCIPEFLSVYETERLVQELSRHRIDVSNIVVNQVLFPIAEADAIVLDPEALGVAESGLRGTTTAYEQQLQSALKCALLKIAFLERNFASRRRMQSKYLQQIDDLYSADFHVVPMPLQPKEVRGVELIRGFSELLKSARDLPILPCPSTAADSMFEFSSVQ